MIGLAMAFGSVAAAALLFVIILLVVKMRALEAEERKQQVREKMQDASRYTGRNTLVERPDPSRSGARSGWNR